MHKQMTKAIQAPAVTQKLKEIGATPVGNSSADFQKFIGEEVSRWQQTVKAANIQAQ
jgi:tripartite-type tricarboxylate transporter receptor subunit TctC